MSSHASKLTIQKAMTESPQLSIVVREMGELETGKHIMKLLTEVAIMTRTTLEPVAAGLTSQMIIQEFSMLRYDEIILALRRGVRGYYGPTSWGGISFQAVMKWMDKYFIERDDEITKQHEIRKNQAGSNADRVMSDKPLGEIIDEKIMKNKIQRISKEK